MMPRGGAGAGYDPMNVCAFCIDFLNITAAGKGMLKTMPLGKLKRYLEAYNIAIDRAVEKDDLIDSIIRARKPNGCLSPETENYYRRYSVPDKSTSHPRTRLFNRSGQSSNPAPPPPPPSNSRPTYFPRPDLAPDTPPHQRYAPPPGRPPPPRQSYPSYQPPPPVPPRPQYQPPPPQYRQENYHNQYHQQSNYQQYHRGAGYHSSPPPPPPPPQAPRPTGYPPYQRPSARSSEHVRNTQPTTTPPRQRAASVDLPAPAAPPPTLEQLLGMPDDAVKALSIGTLKSILFTNHVNAGMILEKGDLVAKVKVLVEDERHERARQRAIEEQEEQDRIERQREMLEEHNRKQREREEREERAKAEAEGNGDGQAHIAAGEGIPHAQEGEASVPSTSTPAPSPPPKSPPKTRGTVADLERTGLCVICQDEEANIAIVDCGYVPSFCRDLNLTLMVLLL
ncbi:hypothetical protein C0991_002805 [Blastosporella zonata]|nr:hypothetical protein C0991_002805 [Blastosporella zonata]